MSETFQQINVALPAHLVEFVRCEAARRDFTVSGLLRHYVAEAARREAPLQGMFPRCDSPFVRE
jgi:CopG-like RHH_1 or ribbon-helix-helix domain, RHH_5